MDTKLILCTLCALTLNLLLLFRESFLGCNRDKNLTYSIVQRTKALLDHGLLWEESWLYINDLFITLHPRGNKFNLNYDKEIQSEKKIDKLFLWLLDIWPVFDDFLLYNPFLIPQLMLLQNFMQKVDGLSMLLIICDFSCAILCKN